jgi:son of sevenless-like protein
VRTCVECKDLNNFSSMSAVCAGLAASSVQRLRKSWEPQSEKTMRDFAMLEALMSSTRNFQKHKEMLKTINPPCVPFLGFYLSMLVFIEDGNRDFVPAPLLDANGNVVRTASMGRTASMTSAMTRAGSTSSGLDGTFGRNSMAPSMTSISTANSNGIAPSNSSTLVASTGSNASNGGDKERPMLINFFKRGLTAEILREIQQYQAQPYNLALCKPVMDFLEEQLGGVTESVDELYEISLVTEPKDRSQVLADERAMGAIASLASMGRI